MEMKMKKSIMPIIISALLLGAVSCTGGQEVNEETVVEEKKPPMMMQQSTEVVKTVTINGVEFNLYADYDFFTWDDLPADVKYERMPVKEFTSPDGVTHYYEAVYYPKHGSINWHQAAYLAQDWRQAVACFEEIMNNMGRGENAVLVQELVKGKRELVAGMTRDPQFGPCVMFGLGGIFTEILKDISFRIAPLEKAHALDMMREIKGHKILDNVRGMDAADLDLLAEILIGLGEIGLEYKEVKEIDINPLILSGNKPVAVDALIVLETA